MITKINYITVDSITLSLIILTLIIG